MTDCDARIVDDFKQAWPASCFESGRRRYLWCMALHDPVIMRTVKGSRHRCVCGQCQ